MSNYSNQNHPNTLDYRLDSADNQENSENLLEFSSSPKEYSTKSANKQDSLRKSMIMLILLLLIAIVLSLVWKELIAFGISLLASNHLYSAEVLITKLCAILLQVEVTYRWTRAISKWFSSAWKRFMGR